MILDAILLKVIFQHNQKQNFNLKLHVVNSDLVDLSNFDKLQNNKFSNRRITECCYKLVGSLMYNSMKNINKYFEFTKKSDIDLNNINVNELSLTKRESTKSNNSSCGVKKYKKYDSDNLWTKKEGYVGLKNLGSICYMNAMLQQFYMVPTIRYSFLQANDNIPELINSEGIDDNVLHQVQEMFSYLTLSQREAYNTKGFCYSFKGFDVSF